MVDFDGEQGKARKSRDRFEELMNKWQTEKSNQRQKGDQAGKFDYLNNPK